jgi:hypothetical protein
MTPSKITYHKVISLPTTLAPNALYYVKPTEATYVDWIITDKDGNPNEVISNERIESLLLPYDNTTLPQDGQVLVFNGTNYVPQNIPSAEVPTDILTHITRIDNPHSVTEDQLIQGIDYRLIFENALI